MSTAQRIVGPRYFIPPFELHWDSVSKPLPMREIHGRAGHAQSPPWFDTGMHGMPFVFTEHLRRLCVDITQKYRPFQHIDVSRILFAITQSRNYRVHGLQAKVTPLRFPDGHRTRLHRGIPFQVQQYFYDRREMFYVMTFCLPRFLNREFEDKFVTIFHELFHISPEFNGDLRRHEGR